MPFPVLDEDNRAITFSIAHGANNILVETAESKILMLQPGQFVEGILATLPLWTHIHMEFTKTDLKEAMRNVELYGGGATVTDDPSQMVPVPLNGMHRIMHRFGRTDVSLPVACFVRATLSAFRKDPNLPLGAFPTDFEDEFLDRWSRFAEIEIAATA